MVGSASGEAPLTLIVACATCPLRVFEAHRLSSTHHRRRSRRRSHRRHRHRYRRRRRRCCHRHRHCRHRRAAAVTAAATAASRSRGARTVCVPRGSRALCPPPTVGPPSCPRAGAPSSGVVWVWNEASGSVSEPCDVHCVSVPVLAWHEHNFETVGRLVRGFTVDPDDDLGCFGDSKHMF